jgi:hypothetical protein
MLAAMLAQHRVQDLQPGEMIGHRGRENPVNIPALNDISSRVICTSGGEQEKNKQQQCGTKTKKLDSPGLTPYHTPMPSGARSLGAAGATEGPARQLWPATLASPLLHEAYTHGVSPL